MHIRIGLRDIALALLAMWLLFAPSHVPAQAPPGEDTDKRLRRLEEKIDKLTALVTEMKAERGQQPLADGPASNALLKLRDKLKQDLELAIAKHVEFRRKGDTPLSGSALNTAANYRDRLAKIDARRAELRIAQARLAERLSLLEQTLKQSGKAVTVQVLAATGLNIERELLEKALRELIDRRTEMAEKFGAKHPDRVLLDRRIENLNELIARKTPPELQTVEAVLTSMRADLDSNRLLLNSLDALFEKEQQEAREIANAEATEKMLRENVERAQSIYEQVSKTIQDINQRSSPKK